MAMSALRRVVLLGYMCSGKSTVGAALARRLEWLFVDLDAEIEHRAGQPVKSLVATSGEASLRAMEAGITLELAHADRVVIAPGGGWVTQPELLDALGAETLSVWLQASPAEVVARLLADESPRPFQDHPDPLGQVTAMMAARQPLYDLADLAVPTDGRSPEEVAFEIERVVRDGWTGAR